MHLLMLLYMYPVVRVPVTVFLVKLCPLLYRKSAMEYHSLSDTT